MGNSNKSSSRLFAVQILYEMELNGKSFEVIQKRFSDDYFSELEKINNQYGHIQEVIIQNFQRKPDIAMAKHPEPTLNDMLETIALARIILSPSISIQAPPNLEKEHIEYINAGINDWGGISPVTKDFINPQHPWPNIDVPVSYTHLTLPTSDLV